MTESPDWLQIIVPKHIVEAMKLRDVYWTIVRESFLTEREKKVEYRVGWVGVNAGSKISRKDLADFIVGEIEEKKFIR